MLEEAMRRLGSYDVPLGRAIVVMTASMALCGSAPKAEDIIDLTRMELWVCGTRITGSRATVRWDGNSLWFNDVEMKVKPRVTPAEEDSLLVRVYGSTPRVKELLTQGFALAEAARQFKHEEDQLNDAIWTAMEAGGVDSAEADARRSPLVRSVVKHDSAYIMLDMWGLGITVLGLHRPVPLEPDWEAQAEGVVRSIEKQKGLVFLSKGTIRTLFGSDAIQAREQIAYVLAGGSPQTMPPGPLRPDAEPMSEILEAHGLK